VTTGAERRLLTTANATPEMAVFFDRVRVGTVPAGPRRSTAVLPSNNSTNYDAPVGRKRAPRRTATGGPIWTTGRTPDSEPCCMVGSKCCKTSDGLLGLRSEPRPSKLEVVKPLDRENRDKSPSHVKIVVFVVLRME
jgi:hypothetical protein